MSFFPKVFTWVKQALSNNYRYLVGLGSNSGPISLIQFDSYDDYVRDTVGSCIEVRSILRSSADIEITGTRASEAYRLLLNGNPHTTVRDFLRQCSLEIDTFGNTMYRLSGASAKVFSKLEPSQVQIILDRVSRRVDGYLYGPDRLQVPKEEVFHLKRGNAFSGLGRSALQELSEYLVIKRTMSGGWRAHFETNGNPDVVIEFEKKSPLTQEQKAEIRRDYAERYSWNQRGARIAIADGGAKITPFKSELGYQTAHPIIRDAIREGYRTPKVVLGDTDDVNFSNAYSSFLVFKMVEIDAWHEYISDELEYFFNQHGYSVTVSISSKLNLDDFRALAGVTGRPEAATVVAE